MVNSDRSISGAIQRCFRLDRLCNLHRRAYEASRQRASSKSKVQARHPGTHHQSTTMKNPSLLTLLVVVQLLFTASPLAAATSSRVLCGWDGRSYAANSTYEANFHRLAAVLPAETASSASHRRNTYRAVGYWPNRLQAASSCRGGGGHGDCAACIAQAFKEVERECPFRREASYLGHNCYLRLAELSIASDYALGTNTMKQTLAMVMIFQAFGLACIFFLFLQAWRHDSKKGLTTRQSPLLAIWRSIGEHCASAVSTYCQEKEYQGAITDNK